ncbi:hypothetical protein BDF22DRAFT_746088 [Syncephalis plumigaleata]|nr:hypothetical protein BDF22DRAFT_746088 [Syncephalis plumigaleata]
MGYTVDIHRPAILVFLEAATVGMIVYAVLLIPILPWNSTGKARVTSTTKIPIEYKWTNTRLMCYYVGSLIIAGLVIMPWVSMHIGQHPILWVVEFLLLDKTRLLLCAFWLACIIMAVCIFNYLDNNTSTTSTSARTNESKTEMPVIRTKAQLYLRRKFFHVLAVGMFIPGILFQPQFMHLAFSVAICAFMLTEYIRCMRIPPYGVSLHEFLIRFLDHRDQGPIILAHVYLLIGCAIPVWLQSNNTLASLAGVITLGIGDAMASTIGIRFGRHYLLGTRKTIEGTLACTIGVWTSLWLFGSSSSWSMLTTSLFISVLECVSEQNDNLLLPLIAFSVIQLQGIK